MTEINLTALMQASDCADKVVDEIRKEREAAEVTLRAIVQRECVAAAEAHAFHKALLLVTPQNDTAAPPAPAQAAEKRDTLAECIQAIHNVLGERATAATDRAVADELKAATGYRYRISTVRKALAEIGKSSRAGDSSLSPQEETENPPVDGALARETDIEMPGFLKRSPKQAAE